MKAWLILMENDTFHIYSDKIKAKDYFKTLGYSDSDLICFYWWQFMGAESRKWEKDWRRIK